MIEQAIYDTLKVLCGGRVYPDVAPANAVAPYITYQQVGGKPVQFVGLDIPSKRNARMMIKVWATTRIGASNIARQIEDLMIAHTTLQTSLVGAFTGEYDEATSMFGTRQDFSVWINR